MAAKMDHETFSDLRIGDHVRLKNDEDRQFEWTVVGRSFGSMSFDIEAGTANTPHRILRGVRPALLERIKTTPEQEA